MERDQSIVFARDVRERDPTTGPAPRRVRGVLAVARRSRPILARAAHSSPIATGVGGAPVVAGMGGRAHPVGAILQTASSAAR